MKCVKQNSKLFCECFNILHYELIVMLLEKYPLEELSEVVYRKECRGCKKVHKWLSGKWQNTVQ